VAQDLTLGVKLTGDGSQLSGTLKDVRNDVREFGTTTEREGDRSERSLSDFGSTAQKEGSKAARALRSTGTEVSSVSNHLGSMQRIATAALTTLVGFVGIRGISNEWSEIRRESELLERNLFRQQQLIETTGRTAERSAQQMLEQSRALALGTLQSTEGVMQAQQTLMTFRNIRGEVFDQAIEGALDLASAMGTDLNSTILQVAKALEDPVTGMTALTRSGTVFTAAQRDMVRGMVETNRTADAQAFILSELAAQYGGVAKAEAAGLAGAQDTIGQAMQEARLEIGEYLQVGKRLSAFYNNTATTIFQFNDALGSGDLDGHIRLMTTTAAAVGAAAGAYATYRAILVSATVAQWAFNTAVRANPLGIAITLLGAAAGAMFAYREEVTLAGSESFQTSIDVDGLTSSFHLLTEAQQENKRASLTADLIEMRVEAGRLGSELVEVSRKVRNSGQLTPQGGALPVATPEDIQKGRELRQELGMLLSDIDNGSQLLSEYDQAMASLGETTRDTDTRTRTLAETNAAASKAADELAKSTQGQADALEDLYDRLIPGRRETVQLARDIQTLNLAIAMGTGNIGQNIQAMGLLQQQFIEAQNDTDDLAKKTVDAAFTMEGAWDEVRLNGLRRLDDGFTDLWEGAIDGSLNAGEIMKRGLNQTLAEMGQMAFTRPITVQFATSMGFGGTGAGGQQAGGGAQSFGGMPSFSGMMDGSGAIANAYRAFQGTGSTYAGTFGSELAVQTQGGLKAGFESFAASGVGNATLGLGGGFVGSKLGGSVFGESKEQQIGATVGGIAGQVLIPIPGVGAGIGSFLGSGLGSLFGSAPTKFSGRFGTTASLDRSEGAGKDGVFEHQADGRFYRETALGYAGFRDQGTERLQRAGVGEDKQWAEDLVNATAAMDALTVSVARSDEQVSTMRDTVQGLEASGRNAGEIIEFALKGRALAALESIGYTFSDAVSSLPADEFTARLEIMAGGMGVLMQSTDRLNLNFDATAAGALEAAGNLAQIAGGVDNLAAINQGYYQATYSETERLSRSQADLRASLAGVTDQVPTTVAELRNMVEAQNLNDAAAGELAVRLMELAPALKQTNDAVRQAIEEQYQESLGRAPDASGMDYWFNQVATGGATLERALSAIAASSEAAAFAAEDAAGSVDTMADALREREQLERQLLTLEGNTAELRRRDLEATDESNRALQQRIWAVQDEQERLRNLERQQQERVRTIQQEASAMARAREQLASFGVSITSYVDNLRSTDAGLGSPADQLAASSQAFYEQYDKAASGDRDAMNSITQYADRFIEAQQGWSASGSQTTATIDKVVGMLESLPEQLSPEQFLADEFRGIITDQTETLGDVFGSGFSNAITSLSQNFDQLDTNLNGLLTYDEIKRALGDKATDAQVAVLIAAVDTNGDGMISRQELTNARLGGLAKGVASSLEGSFDLLDTSLDGLLTYSELRQGLGGLATDAQVKAMMRSMDLNADGVISQLESVVIASMPTDAVLGTVLRNKMTEVGSRQLTHSQVRNALSPIATDAEISRLIREVDVNGDGMISQQELTNSRLGGLSHGIANAVAGEFDRIDLSADGLIDYNEFRKTFAGMATDSQLRRIFNQLDATRTGTISRLDAQTNELVTAAKSIDLSEQEQSIVRALNAQQNSDTVRWWGWNFANEFQRKFKPSVGEGIGVSLAPAQNGDGARSIAKAFKQILGANTNGSHATGLGYVPFDGYIAELHKGEMVATAEDAKVLRELAGGAAMSAPPMPAPRGLPMPTLPAFPLLDQSDQTQLMRDVLNENKQLRADIKKLMSESNKHLAAANNQRGAAAKGQIGAIERGNKMLKRMDDDKRLEAAKR